MRIAIVSAFSEACQPLMQRLLFSCYRAMSKCESHDFAIYCYQCNYDCGLQKSTAFESTPELSVLPSIPITLIESAEIKWSSKLPDIAIYDHFSQNHMLDFDYSLFCHDDIVLKNQNVFEEMINTLQTADWENRSYDLIAGLSANAIKTLSVRFHPCFLFVPTTTFVKRNLSFIHPDPIGNTESFFWYNNIIDGGAQFLASYYNKQNSNDTVPFIQVDRWFQHIKAGSFGMEFSRLMRTDIASFYSKMKEAENSVIANWTSSYFGRIGEHPTNMETEEPN